MSFEHDKRVVIYPAYINSKNSLADGRKVASTKACENPTVLEIADCCAHLKLPTEIENKAYPRQWWVRGRVRVQLLNEDGSLVNPFIPNRRMLFEKVAELVPKHPGRSRKAQAAAAAKQQAAAAAASGSSSSSAPAKQGGKKSGKKKR